MTEKYIRRIRKPFYLSRYNRLIEKTRLKNITLDLDKTIPDRREFFSENEEKVKHIGLRILSILKELSEIYNFQFSLAYGTLLGAIRHNGYIPWDDDIDIFMTKTDLEKFISASHQLPEALKFFTMDVEFFKVMDRSSIVSIDGERGVAVDIFILGEQEDKQVHFFNVHTLRRLFLNNEMYYPLQYHPFESYSFPIPANTSHILKKLYGDYMKLPPVDKRVSHHSNRSSIIINPYGQYLT